MVFNYNSTNVFTFTFTSFHLVWLTATVKELALQIKSVNRESWWGFLPKESMEFYISLFVDMKDCGIFYGGFVDKRLMLMNQFYKPTMHVRF